MSTNKHKKSNMFISQQMLKQHCKTDCNWQDEIEIKKINNNNNKSNKLLNLNDTENIVIYINNNSYIMHYDILK